MNTPPPDNDETLVTSNLFYKRVFALTAAALIGVSVYHIVQPFLQPMAWAAILALFLYPLHRRLTGLLKGRANTSALLLTIFTVLLFIGPLTVLAVAFGAQAQHLLSLSGDWLDRLRTGGHFSLGSVPYLETLFAWLDQHLSISVGEVQQWAVTGATKLLQRLASFGGTAFFGAVGTVLSFTVMLFLLFFLLRDGERITGTALTLVPMGSARKKLLKQRMQDVTRAVVLGTLVTAVVQGLLLGIGFAIAGLPAPVVFGVIGAVLSVVPFGGTALVWVPGAVALFLTGHVGMGIFLTLWGAVLVSSADNFLKPLLIGGKAEVPTLAVFIGVLGGLSAFGLIGMFTGPIVMALVLTLVRFASERPEDTASPPAPTA
jgi:predicted PurR-regulated permease PerM